MHRLDEYSGAAVARGTRVTLMQNAKEKCGGDRAQKPRWARMSFSVRRPQHGFVERLVGEGEAVMFLKFFQQTDFVSRISAKRGLGFTGKDVLVSELGCSTNLGYKYG